MFASKVARATTNDGAGSTNISAHDRSKFVTHRLGHGAVPEADFRHDGADRDACATQGPSWNLGKIPLFSSGQSEIHNMQPKLAVGEVDDPLEQEADRVADQVMRMADSEHSIAAAPLQLSRKCADCDEEEHKLQKKTTGIARGANQAPAIVHDALRSPGQPLDAQTRAFMEPRFGRDFDHVRTHTDGLASASASAVDALAYTVGHNIVFSSNRYVPSTEAGKRLLAHELAHVVQQRPEALGPDRHSQAGVGTMTEAAQPVLARAPAAGHCGGSWTCEATPCKQPDIVGDGGPSNSWELDLNIDTDVEKSTDINRPSDVGHANVVFKESNGTKYSFGFYPRPDVPPNEFISMVPGCIAHPDTTHNACFDYTENYSISQQQYSDALTFAQNLCVLTPKYALFTSNCTTFAVDVAKKAGQSPPSPKGPVLAGTKQSDNPNTLKEGYLDLHDPTRNLKSDSEIRDWISAHNSSDIAAVRTDQKIRLLNRLLDGWVSDDDVAAFEKICASVETTSEQKILQNKLGPREAELNSVQGARVHKALFIVIDTPKQAPGTAQG